MSNQTEWAKGDQWKVKWTARSPVNAALAPDPIVINESNKQTSVRTEDVLEFEVLKTDEFSTVISLELHGDIYELHMIHAGDEIYLKKYSEKLLRLWNKRKNRPFLLLICPTGCYLIFLCVEELQSLCLKILRGESVNLKELKNQDYVPIKCRINIPQGQK